MRKKTQIVVSTMLLGLLVVATENLHADSVQLVNGDVLNGKLISVSEKEVKLSSDVLGEISVQRDKVVVIMFGDRKPAVPVVVSMPNRSDQPTADDVLNQLKADGVDTKQLSGLLERASVSGVDVKPEGQYDKSVKDVVQDLQTQGIDKKMIEELQGKLPLLSMPGVKGYFNKTLGGLSSGELDVTDIRKDAIKARDGLIDIKKDLGPSGVALDGYLRILNRFIDETEPKQADQEKGQEPKAETPVKRGKT